MKCIEPGCEIHLSGEGILCSYHAAKAVQGRKHSAEERVVDPTTGAEKGSKLARFDLIPPEALWALAEHFGVGSKKYTEYGACTCRANAQNRNTLSGSAGPATRKTSGAETPTSPLGSGPIQRTGSDFTLTESASMQDAGRNASARTQNSESGGSSGASSTSMGSPRMSTEQSSLEAAPFAGQRSESTSTTTTALDDSEAPSATPVTSDSDSLSVRTNGSTEHSPTCGSRRVVRSGDRNWERGYLWHLSFAALMRHAWAWWRGEDVDAETGSNHLIAAAWHAFALYTFQRRKLGTDDRVKPEEKA